MSRVPVFPGFILALFTGLVLPAVGQTVVSTHSGLVHYFEGTVSIDGKPLEQQFARFASVEDGSELRTQQGRAEVLLTPGVILRLGEKSAVRMLSSSLADTRVELTAGSAIVDAANDPAPGTSVTIIFEDWNLHPDRKGVYRVDCDPARLHVRDGELAVWTDENIEPVSVEAGEQMPLEADAAPEKSGDDPSDSLSDWANGRSQSVSADNTIAANIEDPGTMTIPGFPADNFTYFPMLGVYSIGSSYPGLYGSQPGMTTPVYQPGFYSIYLPGYKRLPGFIGLGLTGIGHGIGVGLPYSPIHIGVPGTRLPGIGMPRAPIGIPRPGTPVVRPVTPIAPRPGGIRH